MKEINGITRYYDGLMEWNSRFEGSTHNDNIKNGKIAKQPPNRLSVTHPENTYKGRI
jgi:hypothetical protein